MAGMHEFQCFDVSRLGNDFWKQVIFVNIFFAFSLASPVIFEVLELEGCPNN